MIRHIGVYTPRDPGWIQPGSEQHARMISPSKVGAILGLSRWESAYRLWHRMKGLVPPEPPKDAFDLGHDVEPFAANLWRRKNPRWRLSPGEVQFVVDPDYFGFPAVVTLDRRASSGPHRRVVQVKLARDANDIDKFGDDLTGDCPPDYWAQVLVEMLFTGFTTHPGHLLVLGPYFADRIYEVDYNEAAQAEADSIIDECRRFWHSLRADTPPPLDDSVATYDCIKAQHPEIDGTTVDLDPDETLAYAQARVEFNQAEEALQLECNRLLKRMECAQRAQLGSLKVARRQRGSRGSVAFYPSKTITPEQVLQLTGELNDD